MRGAAPILLAALLVTLPGCNLLVVGSFIGPDAAAARPAPAPRSFALGPDGASQVGAPPAVGAFEGTTGLPEEVLPALEDAPEAATPAATSTVTVVGRAMVAADAVGIANVHGGYVTGTPVTVVDARTGRRLAAGVTFFDGSFSLEVPIAGSKAAVVVGTELFAAADQADRTALSVPVNLHVGTTEHRVVITPGTTALTHFLRHLAARMAAQADGLPADPPDLAALVGPRFGALVAGIEDDERDSFARLAESSSELREANDLAGIRAGIDGFARRLTSGASR